MNIDSLIEELLILVSIFSIFRITFLDLSATKLSASVGLIAGMGYFLLIPFLIRNSFGVITANDLEIPDFSELTSDLSLFVLFAFLTSIAAYYFSPLRKAKPDGDDFTPFMLKAGTMSVAWLVFLFSIAGITQGEHWSLSGAGRFGTGGGPIFLVLLNFVNLTILSLPAIVLYSKENVTRRKLSYVVFSLCLVAMAVTGNRIFMLGPLFAIFFSATRIQKIIILCLTPLVLLGASVYSVLRATLWLSGNTFEAMSIEISRAVEYVLNSSNIVEILSSAFESSSALVLSVIVNDETGRFNLGSFETLFFRPIRFIFPYISDDHYVNSVSLFVGRQIGLEGDVAINSTLLGEAWMNGGYIAWLYIVIVVLAIDFMALKSNISNLSRAILFAAAFCSWRFEFIFILIGVFYVVVYESYLFKFKKRIEIGI